ncbi:MAG TPA: hypothetical protein ENI20_12695 [Bacteroides sp.]|nr:hypothetical protein [Bacteroides sp.]
MRFFIVGILIAISIPAGLFAQGLFESAGTDSQESKLPVQFNGYARGALYLGEYSTGSSPEIKSGYGEAGLKINANSGSRARLFSELRFREGYEYNEWISDFTLREAYADLYLGPFELRAGQSIVSWGRADGFNPTNNLTPQDYFVRSPEPDDMRLGNFLVRARYNITNKLRLEAVWVPRYKYSVYRFDLFDMPEYVNFLESPLPEATLKNSSVGAKLDFLFDRFDGSLSWFNGYDPKPGIQSGEISQSTGEDFIIDMYARAFRQQTLGLDFSFGLGSYGVRGEAALRDPTTEYRDEIYAPNRDLRYVLEIDRSFGDFSLMIMYMGQYVFDFTEGPAPGGIPDIDPLMLQDPAAFAMLAPMMYQEIAAFNRVIFDQTTEISHLLALRPALSMVHGVSSLEVYTSYNFSTEEWNMIPKLSWDATDNLKLSIGAQYFEGPENTAYNLIAPAFNGGFFELRYSF